MKSIQDYIIESQTKHYVDGILISPDNEILILRRANYMKKFPGKWGFVGGSIEDKDKDSRAAIKREIKEETSCELTWNEEHKAELFEKITHEDGSITEYWLVKLETKPEIKINKEEKFYSEDVDWKVGDYAYHDTFGAGRVVEVTNTLVSIAFKSPYGIKKLMKNHKSIKKV